MSKSIFKSFLQLGLDRIVQFFNQLFIIFIISKKLGPINYGILSIGLSILALLAVIANWGFDRLLINRFVNQKKDELYDLLITAFAWRVIISLLLYLSLYIFFYFSKNLKDYSYLFVLFPSLIFNSWIVFDSFNQSFGFIKHSVISRIIGFTIGFSFRLLFVLFNLNIYFLLFSFILEQFVILTLMILLHKNSTKRNPLKFEFISIKQLKSFLYPGLLLISSGLSVIFYMKVTQLLVAKYLPSEFLGIYSLIQNLVEIPFSLVSIFSILLIPKLTSIYLSDTEKYTTLKGKILFVFVLLSFIVLVIMVFLGFFLNFYFSEYHNFIFYYNIAILILPFGFLSYFFMFTMFSENEIVSFVRVTFISSLFSILVSFFLITILKEAGSIISLIFSQALPGLILPTLLYKNFRLTLKSSFKHFASPIESFSSLIKNLNT